MEGRGLSDLYRNTSEEIFLRSYMESSMGISVPTTTTTVDVLGFKNLSQNFRTDSEELFKSWLSNGESNGTNSPSLAHRTRQASRRISTEIANSTSQQNFVIPQNKRINDNSVPQSSVEADDIITDINHHHHSVRNVIEKGLPASEVYLAKAWFHSPQPMTRNRSSELRKKFVAMQSAQTTTTTGFEALHNVSTNDINPTNQDHGYNSNGLNVPTVYEMSFQTGTFMSPSNSSSSTFNASPLIMGEMDKVSSVVSMLKGTLERKKLTAQVEKEVLEDESSNGVFQSQDFIIDVDQIYETPLTFHEVLFPVQVKDSLEGFVSSLNPIQSSQVSQEQSQSESSGVAPVISSGFDTFDGPSNSSQAISASENGSRKQSRNRNSENSSKAKDIRERIIGSLKEDPKKGSLQRHGSVTSAISGDKEDATKKRRVERSRKMAEAKERNLTPIIPTDMQSVLKRCETLEKEVRSLKLNLSFMNRKDSEQTKQIEELQKQNEELHEEKECLVEEINKIITETRKIQ